MSAQRNARTISLAALAALLGAAACSDDNSVVAPTRSVAPREAKHDISVSSSAVVLLSVDVYRPGTKFPLTYNLPAAAGKGAALSTPAGSELKLVVRGYDVYGNATHQGTIGVASIRPGLNEPLALSIPSLAGGEDLQVKMDVNGEELSGGGSIVMDGAKELDEGGSASTRAYVVNAKGERLDINPAEIHWAVSDPHIARLAPNRSGTTIQALRAGDVDMIAIWRDVIGKLRWPVLYNPYIQITAGADFTCGLRQKGTVACWGDDNYSQLGVTATSTGCFGGGACNDHQVVLPTTRRYKSISAGAQFVCGIETSAQISCWGRNDFAQLGRGLTGSPDPTPQLVNSFQTYTSLTTGGSHACAIVAGTNGDGACWGYNSFGQVGDGNPAYFTFNPMQAVSPTSIIGGHKWLSLAAGSEHTCGVTTTNRALCWGSNYYGELGIGPFQSTVPTPDTVNTPINPPMMAAFASHSGYTQCWIRQGSVGSCNGQNDSGQVGKGASSQSGVLQPAGLWANPPLVMMSVGGKHVCGVDGSDNLWCWGDNYYGQIANPNYYFLNHPLQPGNYKFMSVAAGRYHTCGLTRTNDIYCWGRNQRGQLGIGSVSSWTLTPTLIVP